MGTEVTQRRGERSGEFLGGKYLLEACLGIGGMGEVYRATNVSLGRKVAIKVLAHDMVDNEDDVMRFLREARAAAAVRHPNVVDVLDVARDDDGTPFIVQELLSGEDLEHYVRSRGGRLSAEEALEILIPVAEAVAVAHARDVVHRDLKPANIFLAREGTRITPKVLDFGACLFPTLGAAPASEKRLLIGTPHYMAPEQVTDRAGVDARADVWALGVILWELLVGEPPFQGSTAMDVLRLVKAKEVPPLRERVPDAPVALAALVASCTVRDKTARLGDANELVRRMRDLRDASKPPSRSSVATLPDMSDLALDEPELEDAPRSRKRNSRVDDLVPPVRPKFDSDEDATPSGLDLAIDKPLLSSIPPVLDARNAGPAPPPPPKERAAPAALTATLPSADATRRASEPRARAASEIGVPTPPAAFAVSNPRTLRTPITPVSVPRPAPSPLSRSELGRLAGIVLGPAVVVHGLLRLAPVTRPIGHALRGDSIMASGVATVFVLVVAATLAAKSLAPERTRSTTVAAAAAFALGILMIIMTFSASESAALGIPPVASGLVPFLAPVFPCALAVGLFARARDAWRDHGERRSATSSLVMASLLVLLALEVGPTGAVRSAAANVAGHAGP